MNIIFDDEMKPGDRVINYMIDAGEFCLAQEGVDTERAEVSVTFVTPDEIHELNKVYRNVDKITDVLSFPQFSNDEEFPEEGTLCLGDVVICPEQAFIQADEFGHSNERELVYLFVHSIWHLLGYDHMDEQEKEQMREREEMAMNKIGLFISFIDLSNSF